MDLSNEFQLDEIMVFFFFFIRKFKFIVIAPTHDDSFLSLEQDINKTFIS